MALVGLPNVGKSTLLNLLVGQKLSIVTPRAQTTRQRVVAIYTDDRHQAVFLDTPGLLEPRYLLQRSMREEALAALRDADVAVYVADAGFPASLEEANSLRPTLGDRPIFCLNKIDRVGEEEARRMADRLRSEGWETVIGTVATAGKGVEELRHAILARLPASPAYYPAEELSTAPVRFFVAEFVRETCFEQLGEEVPYGVAVLVEEFRDRGSDRPVYISATLFVERESQKGIVIGSGGRRIRSIGQRSREKVEAFLGRPVYLELRVKVLPNWRKRGSYLKMLGYRKPSKERRHESR